MNEKTRKLTLMAMLGAMAYVAMLLSRVLPSIGVSFLKYDPQDVFIAIGGFLMGPAPAALISLLVALIEMLTVGTTGFIGFFMNVLSTCAFACPAAMIYHRRHSMRGAVVGLGAGVVLMTAVMLAWNYLITPYYMGISRAAVVEMLVPVFLPFNLLKGGLNAGITMLIYKPVSKALRKARFAAPSAGGSAPAGRTRIAITVAAVILVATCLLCFITYHA